MSRDLIRLMHSLFLPTAVAFREASWRPAVDICRTAHGWLVKFDLAGVRTQDIQVIACGKRLCIRGQRRDWTEHETHTYHRMEIAYGWFERTLDFPDTLEAAEISSEYQDGILLIRIRTEEAPDESRS
jgi:HSP20 family protein